MMLTLLLLLLHIGAIRFTPTPAHVRVPTPVERPIRYVRGA